MGRVTLNFTVIAMIALGVACNVQAQDYLSIAVGNANLSVDEVAALEEKVDLDPEDIASRAKLLGYYFLARRQDDSIRAARQGHVLWLIEHAPTLEITGSPYAGLDSISDPDGYVAAKTAWLKQIEAELDDVRVLGNASRFFTLTDRELAVETLEKAHALDLKNPEWLERLGQIHFLEMYGDSPAKRTNKAKTALEYFEAALSLSDPNDNHLLTYVSRSALAADEPAKARGYAKQMLKFSDSDWNAGNNIHHGNLVLGQLAMREGAIEDAKKYLLAAGETPGSPQLNSFGPNMALALELVEAGENETVLAYFDRCSKFWKRKELDIWAGEIKAGRTPNFGANLMY